MYFLLCRLVLQTRTPFDQMWFYAKASWNIPSYVGAQESRINARRSLTIIWRASAMKYERKSKTSTHGAIEAIVSKSSRHCLMLSVLHVHLQRRPILVRPKSQWQGNSPTRTWRKTILLYVCIEFKKAKTNFVIFEFNPGLMCVRVFIFRKRATTILQFVSFVVSKSLWEEQVCICFISIFVVSSPNLLKL